VKLVILFATNPWILFREFFASRAEFAFGGPGFSPAAISCNKLRFSP
jgi:hypothetical protein